MTRSAFFWPAMALLYCSLQAHPASGAFSVLHHFAGHDGRYPSFGRMAVSGSTLFGVTGQGGENGAGVVYSINTDGGGFQLLHEFAGGPYDGADPTGDLSLSGSTLFGVTTFGGDICFLDYYCGTVFSLNIDGSGFKLLHKFHGGANDGKDPSGLLLSGSTLYGATPHGGDACIVPGFCGTIFSIESDGSDYQVLHEFDALASADDRLELVGLTLSGSTLFGVTGRGGGNDRGTIFSINTDGSDYRLLHEFVGGSNDGSVPYARLTQVGDTLLGATNWGGDYDLGTIYSIGTDGSGYRLLHEFAGGANDGAIASSALTQRGSTLFGTTQWGGDACPATDYGCGTIYSIGADGTGFTLRHEFALDEGFTPSGDLILDGSTLFGTASAGGINDAGTIFAFELPLESPHGDTDLDGDVDLDDLNNVRNYFGGIGLGDADGDLDVDLDDLNVVRNNFGATSGGAIPEPSSQLLLAIAAAALLALRRRRALSNP